MTSFTDPARVLRLCAFAALLSAGLATRASAADMPDTFLRGGNYPEPTAPIMRWDGIALGATFGWTNMKADFTSAFTAMPTETKDHTNSAQFGGFLGYNMQWETLVLGIEGTYSRPSALDTSVSNPSQSASYKLVDYGTVRGRAGYAIGQFLPYAFLGGAVARVNYSTPTGTKDNAFAPGFAAGVGLDVAILPNVFLRAEYEYVLIGQIADIRANISTARAGVGIRF